MRRPQRIMWDWNGTLLDDAKLCVEIMNGMLAEEGVALRLTHDAYQEVFAFPIRSYYERLGFDVSGNHFERLARRFIDEYDTRVYACSLHAGAKEQLESLRERGIVQNILTAARAETVQRLVEHHRIAHLLDAVVGLDDDYAHSKIEVGARWFARCAIEPRHALLVGDTVHDHEVAKALGVGCLLVSHGHCSRRRLEACGREVLSDLFRSPSAWD